MKNGLFLLSTVTAALVMSGTASATLILDIPPILAASKTPCTSDAECSGSEFCCEGFCRNSGFCCADSWHTTGECCNNVYKPDGTAGFCCADSWHTTGFCCDDTYSATDCSSSTPVGKLNDTGITAKQADYDDSQYGRDVGADNSDGHAGFDFSVNGGCIKDNVTNLLWSPTIPGTSMDFSTADTKDEQANTDNLCGQSSGWRIPTITELLSLVSYDVTTGATIDTIFSDTQASWYWTVTAGNGGKWGVNFTSGSVANTLSNPSYLRLVNGPELKGNFQLEGAENQYIHDSEMGLTWKRCIEGFSWNETNKRCEGSPIAYTWQDALDLTDPAPGEGWRLPNLKELQSIVGASLFPVPSSSSEYNPPIGPSNYVWSSSSYAGALTKAWLVNPTTGEFLYFDKETPVGYVRLVKDAP